MRISKRRRFSRPSIFHSQCLKDICHPPGLEGRRPLLSSPGPCSVPLTLNSRIGTGPDYGEEGIAVFLKKRTPYFVSDPGRLATSPSHTVYNSQPFGSQDSRCLTSPSARSIRRGRHTKRVVLSSLYPRKRKTTNPKSFSVGLEPSATRSQKKSPLDQRSRLTKLASSAKSPTKTAKATSSRSLTKIRAGKLPRRSTLPSHHCLRQRNVARRRHHHHHHQNVNRHPSVSPAISLPRMSRTATGLRSSCGTVAA